MLVYPNIVISSTKITNGIGYGSNSSDLIFSELGYKDLDLKQIEILGMALTTQEGYKYPEDADEKGFSQIIADWNYWRSRIEHSIDSIYNTKVAEYDSTYKSIY